MRAPRRPSPDGAQEAGAPGRRLGVLSLGFLTQPALRRILGGAGWSVRLGPPFCPADAIGVWGRRGPARRGIAVARWRDLPLVTVEDAFLRSVRPGRAEPPAGLLIDGDGVHYDPAHPSRIETLLTGPEVEDPETLVRAARARALLTHLGLSKYNAWEEAPGLPAPGFVLLLDQTAGDAAVTASAATRETFRAVLAAARAEHPGRAILIRTHPEVAAGRKSGHFGPEDAETDVTLDASPVPPAALLARAHAVYTVSSQTGFEAILAGHRPRVFGQPFYAGWDLSD
ncbi:MAG: capsular polysaccharide biosynthesis protein, partial [Pseudomonadota bacterium]